MNPIYDNIGINYSGRRQTDPRIESRIHNQLAGAKRIVNIGAGTGSYEPKDIDLVAVEPSAEMIAQRPEDAHPVVQAYAEALPFEDNSFSHAMAILTMHHWTDRTKAFEEISRVTTDTFVTLSWIPYTAPFWLTRDYFPEFYEMDTCIFPSYHELDEYFDEVLMRPILIAEDCRDGFLAAYWKRPEAYLLPEVRQSMSSFAKLDDPSKGLQQLQDDLESGAWAVRNKDILDKSALDAGYVLISAKIKQS